jgi:TP901 family phage tail tape measure protein
LIARRLANQIIYDAAPLFSNSLNKTRIPVKRRCNILASWVIGVSVVMLGNGLGKSMSQASAQAAGVSKQIAGVSKQMNALGVAGRILDRAMIGVGLASGAMLVQGIKGASDLQENMLQAAIALGRTRDTVAETTANMKDMRATAISMSKITGQSLPQAMEVIATLASGGITAKQIKTDLKPIAQFEDVLHFGKDKMDYGEAATLATGLLHELRLYSVDQTRFGAGEIARMGYLSPHGVMQLATQVRLAAPTLENLLPGTTESKAKQIVDLTAWADRLGGLQRFGSGMQQLVTNMVAPRSKRVIGAMEDLGVYDKSGRNKYFNQRTGEFDVIGALKEVSTHLQQAINLPGGRGQAVASIMGLNANASRNLALLSSKEAQTAFASVQAQQKSMGVDPAIWLDKTQELIMGQFAPSVQLLTSDIQTITSLIGDSMLPALTKIVKGMTDVAGRVIDWLTAHPKETQMIGVGMLAAAGYAAWQLVQMFGGLIHIFQKIPGTAFTIGTGGHLLEITKDGAAAAAAAAAAGAGGAVAGASKVGIAARILGSVSAGLGSILGFSALRSGISGAIKGAFTFRGFPGGGGIPGGMAGLGRDMMIGLKGIPGVIQFGKALQWLGNVFGMARGATWVLHIGLSMFGATIAKIGARVIPFVGEFILIVDAINFAMHHMKDFGWILGELAGWIAAAGVGLFRWMKDNLPGIFVNIGKLACDLMKGLLQEMLTVLNPMNWAKMISDLANGIRTGFLDAQEQANAKTLSDADKKRLAMGNPSKILTGGLQPKPVPVIPGLHLPAARAAGPNAYIRQRTREVVPQSKSGDLVINGLHIDARGHKDPVAAGQTVATVFGHTVKKMGLVVNTAIGSGQGGAAHAAAH